MKRDMDLVRKLLFLSEEIAGGSDLPAVDLSQFEEFSEDDVLGHLRLIEKAGLVEESWATQDDIGIGPLTWFGHDFLDSVRDPEVWRKTKETAAKAGGFTFSILGDIAKGLITTQIEKHTGVEL